jgi:hypothetical protein
MFEDPRAEFVLDMVVEETTLKLPVFQCVRIGVPEVEKFLKDLPDQLKMLDATVLQDLEKRYTAPSPEYLAHTVDHSYHMIEAEKRLELVRQLFLRLERCEKSSERINSLLEDVQIRVEDRLIHMRIWAAMGFLKGEVKALERGLF